MHICNISLLAILAKVNESDKINFHGKFYLTHCTQRIIIPTLINVFKSIEIFYIPFFPYKDLEIWCVFYT